MYHIFIKNKTKIQRKDKQYRYIGSTINVNKLQSNLENKNKYVFKIQINNNFNTVIEPINIKYYNHVYGCIQYLGLERISNPCYGVILLEHPNLFSTTFISSSSVLKFFGNLLLPFE